MTDYANRILQTLAAFVMIVIPSCAFALAFCYSDNKPIVGSWPKGLSELINVTNRVHGFAVNASDVFFFSGSTSQLTAFLRDCAKLEGVASRHLVLKRGVGGVYSMFDQSGRPCDWKLLVCPKSWYDLETVLRPGTNSSEVIETVAKKLGKDQGCVLEIHFWMGGSITLEQVDVPKNFEVRKEPTSDMPNQDAAANRRPAGQWGGSNNVSATVPTYRGVPSGGR